MEGGKTKGVGSSILAHGLLVDSCCAASYNKKNRRIYRGEE